MNPLVSIIIPTYNRAKDLKRALESVFCQTYSNWEVCIVDNYSNDGTIKLINSLNDSRLKLYRIRNNGVIGASRNLGMENANGKYISFLDSDDWWSSQKLEVSVEALENGANVVYHDMLLVTKLNQKIFLRKARTRKLKTPVFNDLLIGGNAIITSSVVMNKEILNRIEGFQEKQNLIGIEDYDAWLRVAKITDNFKKIPKTLGYYWSGGGNTSNPQRTIQILNVLEKNYQNEISKLGAYQCMYWFNYNRARAFYILGLKEKARQGFNTALAQHPTSLIKFKCMIMILVISTKVYFEKKRKY